MVDLAIIIVSYNTSTLTEQCLETIFKNNWKTQYQVWVVDNASTDNSVKMIEKKFPKVRLIKSDINLGFSQGNNLAYKKAKAKYYLFLNSDTKLCKGSLDELVNYAQTESRKGYGVFSCQLLNNDGSLQPNVGALPKFAPLVFWLTGVDDVLSKFGIEVSSYHQMNKSFYKGEREVGWVAGTAFLVTDQVKAKVGIWDKKIFMYAEDVDYCWRAKKQGLKVGWTEKAKIIHLGGGSSKDPRYRQWLGEFRGLIYLYQKYYGIIGGLFLRLMFYKFIILRMIAFAILGKKNHLFTYGKVLVNI